MFTRVEALDGLRLMQVVGRADVHCVWVAAPITPITPITPIAPVTPMAPLPAEWQPKHVRVPVEHTLARGGAGESGKELALGVKLGLGFGRGVRLG